MRLGARWKQSLVSSNIADRHIFDIQSSWPWVAPIKENIPRTSLRIPEALPAVLDYEVLRKVGYPLPTGNVNMAHAALTLSVPQQWEQEFRMSRTGGQRSSSVEIPEIWSTNGTDGKW